MGYFFTFGFFSANYNYCRAPHGIFLENIRIVSISNS